MDIRQLLNGLDLYDDKLGDQEVEAISKIYGDAVVDDGMTGCRLKPKLAF